MTVDPTEPDTYSTDAQQAPGPEAPEADTAEQHTDLLPHEDESLADPALTEAAEGDLAEQARVVPLDLDEDDHSR
ncbi:hypothetical protein ACIRBX_36400 [Kitasatospora sp. NPDC096147]|uniref:hypothetical protein n=1 Tax=Kitasatospora sp. NPDC096147 TaxID=3364093 RepID=UPI0038145AC7